MHDHSSCVFFVISKKVYYLLLGKCPTNGIRFTLKNIILGYSSVSNRRKTGTIAAVKHVCVYGDHLTPSEGSQEKVWEEACVKPSLCMRHWRMVYYKWWEIVVQTCHKRHPKHGFTILCYA
jgi:hypothetical protein